MPQNTDINLKHQMPICSVNIRLKSLPRRHIFTFCHCMHCDVCGYEPSTMRGGWLMFLSQVYGTNEMLLSTKCRVRRAKEDNQLGCVIDGNVWGNKNTDWVKENGRNSIRTAHMVAYFWSGHKMAIQNWKCALHSKHPSVQLNRIVCIAQ